MATPHEAEIDLGAYARLTVAVARAGADRDAVLEANGLDETRWQSIDDAWQGRLFEAMDQITEEEPVPKFIQDFSRAMDEAQNEDASPLTLDRFAEITRDVRSGGDVGKVLERLGVTLDAYLRANRYFMRKMVDDEELAASFQRALG